MDRLFNQDGDTFSLTLSTEVDRIQGREFRDVFIVITKENNVWVDFAEAGFEFFQLEAVEASFVPLEQLYGVVCHWGFGAEEVNSGGCFAGFLNGRWLVVGEMTFDFFRARVFASSTGCVGDA